MFWWVNGTIGSTTGSSKVKLFVVVVAAYGEECFQPRDDVTTYSQFAIPDMFAICEFTNSLPVHILCFLCYDTWKFAMCEFTNFPVCYSRDV